MTAALILAAGSVAETDSRTPLDILGGVSSIRRVISVFQMAGIEKIVVITGYDAGAIERHCVHMGVVFIRNPNYETADMLSSIVLGLQYLKDKCTRLFITPAKTAMFSADTVKNLETYDAPIVVPVYNKAAGHPILHKAELFDEIIAYEGPGGLKQAVSENVQRQYVDVSDEGILIQINSGEVSGEIIDNHCLRKNIRPQLSLRLTGECDFFNPDAYHLLTLIDETGSIKYAARLMGISYSKARQIVELIEFQIGYTVMKKNRGGPSGGRTDITREGHSLMEKYEAFEEECREYMEMMYAKHFGTEMEL